ncbi:MAG: alpha-amylase [Bacteroidetes bacterium]|nr:MAG: alpha-amylase [Bacteroidota bacterium]
MKKTAMMVWMLWVVACNTAPSETSKTGSGKIVIYQAFTRLWGNTNTTNKPWGTIKENGVGKFADFTDLALDSLKALGITHIWYTGVPHHALVNDYNAVGIDNDDPDVVKGRAGSPYAVKDYYNVNPDLATNPAKRLDEFKALVERTHRHGLQVIIDIVPNHIARHYKSGPKPDSVTDFGAEDDTTVAYHRNNSFYYIPGQPFLVPKAENGYQPLGGEAHPLADAKFAESPAKWTGNGSRLAQPNAGDWYETIKINYGIRPDGTKDFDTLPAPYATKPIADHQAFWQQKSVPLSWKKFRDIALFWLSLGVDGFRYDMAEMVPVEFWSYMNAAIKTKNPNAVLLAEVYNPAEYRNYINLGKMDYLYDKVDLYDTLKRIVQGNGGTDGIVQVRNALQDIDAHLIRFLENHDEQRIASPAFAGNPQHALPAMVLSATLGKGPTLIYFGQEVGEPGNETAGFGQPTRTSIFDYVGVPHHQRWLNGGKCDGGQLSPSEQALRQYYQRLLAFTTTSPALTGNYAHLHAYNRQTNPAYNAKLFAFARWQGPQKLLIINNFSSSTPFSSTLMVSPEVIKQFGLAEGKYPLVDALKPGHDSKLVVSGGAGTVLVNLAPLQSAIFVLNIDTYPSR